MLKRQRTNKSMINNIKKALVIPVLLVLSLAVWILWSVILSAEWTMKSVEHLGDKFFNWAHK